MKMFIYLYNSHAYQDIQQSNCLQSWGTLLVQTPQWSPAHCHLQQQARVNRLKLDNLRNDSRLNFLQLSCKCWLPPWWFAHLLLIPQVQAIVWLWIIFANKKKMGHFPEQKLKSPLNVHASSVQPITSIPNVPGCRITQVIQSHFELWTVQLSRTILVIFLEGSNVPRRCCSNMRSERTSSGAASSL